MNGMRQPCSIAVHPWYRDHSVNGKTVFPAVETMSLLAAQVKSNAPHFDVRVMREVRFGKLLEIPEDIEVFEALVECQPETSESLKVKLLTQQQLAKMTRIKEHGEVLFQKSIDTVDVAKEVDPAPPKEKTVKTVEAHYLYRHLVPFGESYRTLQNTLLLTSDTAWGELRAPRMPVPTAIKDVIGSPFPLDGAMHAACVLGQQRVSYPPFPVGFAERRIHRPTQADADYLTRVTLVASTPEELVFDLQIFDKDGKLYESISAMRMRDVRHALKKNS